MKLKLEEFKRTEEKPAIELFHDGIKNEVTRFNYKRILRRLLCDVFQEILSGNFEERVQKFVNRTREDPKWAVDLMLNFLELCKKRTSLPKDHPDYLDPDTISNYIKPVKKLLDMNDVIISWKRIYAALPESENKERGRGYTKTEISNMLKSTADPTNQAIILTAASSGIRAGAFDFEWKDIIPVYLEGDELKTDMPEINDATIACAAILIYRDSKYEYLAFITPEAYDSLMEHKKKWIKQVGREPLPSEPVFLKIGKRIVAMNDSDLRVRITRLAIRCGIRSTELKRKHEIPAMNGFRRFWNKTVKNTRSIDVIGSLIKKEYMMGHEGVVSLDRNYFQTLIVELAKEYLTVVPELTITEEHRLKIDNTKLKKERDELLELAREAVGERDKAIESLKKQLGKR